MKPIYFVMTERNTLCLLTIPMYASINAPFQKLTVLLLKRVVNS